MEGSRAWALTVSKVFGFKFHRVGILWVPGVLES